MTWNNLIQAGTYQIAWNILDHLNIYDQRDFAMINRVTYELYQQYQDHNLAAFEHTFNLAVSADHFGG